MLKKWMLSFLIFMISDQSLESGIKYITFILVILIWTNNVQDILLISCISTAASTVYVQSGGFLNTWHSASRWTLKRVREREGRSFGLEEGDRSGGYRASTRDNLGLKNIGARCSKRIWDRSAMTQKGRRSRERRILVRDAGKVTTSETVAKRKWIWLLQKQS